MRLRLMSKLGSGAVVLLAIAIVTYAVFFNRVIDSIYGGQTRLVEHIQFQVDRVPTAIINVSVLSPDGQDMLSDRTVFIDAGKIVSITKDGNETDGMLVIDGHGKFLIPGLVDSHVHLQRSPNDLLLYVANGVTEIRDMSGSRSYLKYRQEIENGRIGPRLFAASPQLVTNELVAGWYDDTIKNTHSTQNIDQAVEAARKLVQQGYDGIKLYGYLEIESYRAVLDVADQMHIPTIGHLPDDMPLSELRTTKLQQIGHIEEIVKALLREFGDFDSQGGDAFRKFVRSRADEISDDLATNDISVHSTLWFMESINEQVFDLETLIADVSLEYANPGIVEGSPYSGTGWLPGTNQFQIAPNRDPKEIPLVKNFWDAREDAHHIILEALVRRGVRVLAATDTSASLVIPGFALHDELKSLNRAGMSPAQTLFSATAAPAQLINSNAGIIAPGRRADLVLLGRNPLVDIENTSAIEAVILNGRFIDRDRLDALLDAVKKANASSRNFDLSLYQ